MNTEESIKTLQKKIEGWDTATILDKILPQLDKFTKLKNRMKDPSVAKAILTRLDRLFILNQSVEEIQRRQEENLDPVILFDGIKATTKLMQKYPQFYKNGW